MRFADARGYCQACENRRHRAERLAIDAIETRKVWLCWLRAEVEGWVEMPDYVAEFETTLLGRSCVVQRLEHDWSFDFSGGGGLVVSVPWRIVSNGRIVLASADDGHWFGLRTSVDGEAVAGEFLQDSLITAASLDAETADLTLHFGTATRINIFNNSLGYEDWNAGYTVGEQQRSLIALGGGGIAFFAGSTFLL